jgi:uncharacterized protein (TIGR01777 family)
MATILITGGTGLVGKALSAHLLSKGHSVIILSRDKKKTKEISSDNKIQYAYWDLNSNWVDAEAIAKADYIVHLAGAGVADKRWSTSRKKEILDSRVNSGLLIANALATLPNKVKAVIGASAIGWYGPDPQIPNENPFKEDAPWHQSYLGDTCYQWENAISTIEALGIRRVTLRIGIVLSKEGGALKEFLKPLQFGLATVMGTGKQIVSWIHINDLVSLIDFSINSDAVSGVYNAVSPQPVSNKDLVKALAKAKGGFYFLAKAPAFVLKLVLGEMSIEVLKSATVSASKILSTGFQFQYSAIEKAMQSFFDKRTSF